MDRFSHRVTFVFQSKKTVYHKFLNNKETLYAEKH